MYTLPVMTSKNQMPGLPKPQTSTPITKARLANKKGAQQLHLGWYVDGVQQVHHASTTDKLNRAQRLSRTCFARLHNLSWCCDTGQKPAGKNTNPWPKSTNTILGPGIRVCHLSCSLASVHAGIARHLIGQHVGVHQCTCGVWMASPTCPRAHTREPKQPLERVTVIPVENSVDGAIEGV